MKGATYLVRCPRGAVAGERTIAVDCDVLPADGGTGTFDTALTLSNVTDQAWVTGSALYTSPTDNSSLTFFIQTQNGNLSSFYVDNISIAQIQGPPGPPGNTTGASATFESGTAEGWRPRIGRETVSPSSADAHSGSFSLLTTGRQATFDGPAFDVTNVMFNGSRYVVSVWAKLAPGQPDSQLRVSLQRNAGSFTSFHTVVGNTTVTANAWVRLQATFDDALANTSLTMYVETNRAAWFATMAITACPAAVAEADIRRSDDGPVLPDRRGGRHPGGHPGRAGFSPKQALQQHNVGQRHEVGRDRAHRGDVHLRPGRRRGLLRQGQ
jgi:endo-1,4-beta-xylanase